MKLVTAAQMGDLERQAEVAGITVAQLMENAGLAVAQETWLLLGEVYGRNILVLVGPGNNGGDGLVAARHLHEWGASVRVHLLRPRSEDDANYRQVVELDMPVAVAEADPDLSALESSLAEAHAVIDALLGTGAARPIEGTLAAVLDRLRAARSGPRAPRLVAVDLSTGLDGDSGRVDPHCVAADVTVALGHGKAGLYVLPGAAYAGRVQVADIGIPKEADADLPLELLTAEWVRARLPERPPDAHKGTFGRALVVAGSINYVGAAYLATSAAMRMGAGLVTLACPHTIYPILAAKLTESTFLPLPDVDGRISAEAAHTVRQALADYDVLLVGCGLGQSATLRAFLDALLADLPSDTLRGVVIDADGLNNLAGTDQWWRAWSVPTVVTPHPGEMARLTGLPVPDIQHDRLATALRQAAAWDKVVVLKGANTIVAAPDGRAAVSPYANPVLASAGTGDVLAGAVAGLMAQGVAPFEAAACAVYLHGAAGDRLRRQWGSAGGLAGDLLPLLPACLGELRREIEPAPSAGGRPGFLDLLGQMTPPGASGRPGEMAT